ncbi:hypothetical protein Paride_0360 [Pseudomonas phage Paride]|nr:hypothetical protein Paride_0360 [Pseudomonas phage Paride]
MTHIAICAIICTKARTDPNNLFIRDYIMSKYLSFSVNVDMDNTGLLKWLRPTTGRLDGFEESVKNFVSSFRSIESSPTVFQVYDDDNQPLQVSNMSCFFRYFPVYGMCLAPGSMVREQYRREILDYTTDEFCSFSNYFSDGKAIRGGAVLWWDVEKDLVWSVSPELIRLVYARLQSDMDIGWYHLGQEVMAVVPLRSYPNDVARWKYVQGNICGIDDQVSIRSNVDGRVTRLNWEYIVTQGG